MKKRPNRLLITLLFAGVIVLWAASWPLVSYLFPGWNERSAFGDMFGAVNALFSALAFAGLIIAIYLQTQELSLQRTELKETKGELRRTAEAQEKSEKALSESVALSKEMIVEMRAARLQEIAPHVIVFVDMPYGDDWVMYLVIKNTGRTIAKDIKIKFDPPLMTGMGENVREFDIYLLREGISSLAPGQEIRTPLDVFSSYDRDKLPTVYKVSVSYSDGLRPEREETNHVIDLSMFDDLSVLQKKGEQDLINAMEELARSTSEVRRHTGDIAGLLLRGVWLKNPELYITNRKMTLHAWKEAVFIKLNESKWLWSSIYGGDFRRRGGFIRELKSRMAIAGGQILLLASSAPADVPAGLIKSLIDVSKKLDELSSARLNMSQESYLEFNASGDEVIKGIDSIIQDLDSSGRGVVEPTEEQAE